MSNQLIIDVRVNGYKGEPMRIVATCDPATGLVYISGQKVYRKVDKKPETEQEKALAAKTLIVTDAPEVMPKWNLAFYERENLDEAVQSYQGKSKNGLLQIHESIQGRFNLESILAARKLDMGGQVWELNTETENGHICILLAAWAATKASAGSLVADLFEEDNEDSQLDQDDMSMGLPFSF